MNSNCDLIDEPRWAGAREVLAMSGPIILGSLSYTFMEFCDKAMVSQIGTDAIAATGSAGIWSYTLAVLFIGVVGCVSTFASQSLGRGVPENCARYTWQGVYLSIVAGLAALLLWPVSETLFGLMRHNENVTGLELSYFRVRLLGYMALSWSTAIAAFFQAINRSMIPTYAAVAANIVNLGLNYLLIYGHFGFPQLGVVGAAIATLIAQWVQALLLQAVFLARPFHEQYHTRSTWHFDWVRIRELVGIGLPNGMTMFLDIANWAIFTSFLVGSFGAASLAAHNIALSFMHLSFMPAMALNQGIAPIVGQWIGRGDLVRARARTYTALRLASCYMFCMGLVFAAFGGRLIGLIFSDDTEVIGLGHNMLILAAMFQGFDALTIVGIGALRGAGDTRWMMWVMFFGAYFIFLPLASLFAIPFGGGAYGAWVGATVYIIILAGLIFYRFHSGRWEQINIFREDAAGGAPGERVAPEPVLDIAPGGLE